MKTILLLLTSAAIIAAGTINISITPGEHWEHSFKMGFFTVNTTPQYAFWLADSSGKYVETIAVSEKSANSKFSGARKTSRPEALPVWAFARGIKSKNGNFMPSRKEPLTDAVSSASSSNEVSINYTIPDSLTGKKLRIFVEVNGSMDFNEYYSQKAKENDPGFNNSVNGQPSLIYDTDLHESMSQTPLKLIGHGEAAGKDGSINTDLTKITTAKEIVKEVTVTGSVQ